MNEKNLILVMRLIAFISFLMGLFFITERAYLSLSLISGSIFFIFLSKNTNILLCSNIEEIDNLIPKLQGKTFLYGAFIVFSLNTFFLF